jgi:two-component system nitrogen regulation response regulator GlnG
MPKSVLIVDDEEAVAWALQKACERRGFRVSVAASAEEALKTAGRVPPDVIFLDIRLPGMDGLSALEQFHQVAPHAAVIIMTAHGSLSTAVQAVVGGAFDYLAKPFDLEQALDSLARAAEQSTPEAPVLPSSSGQDEIIGRSPAIQTVFKRIALAAPTNACVLITGESGTGKELVARALHRHSLRQGRPLIPVHIAALNPNLVESELFGHVRGSFTGADRAHQGLIALASGGTIFLDELGDIPLPVQAKLLRVLERQEVLPVGGVQPVPVDVRIISATNANLSEAVREGRFRQDLFFRLNVYPIHLPALRERRDDIPLLAEHFLNQFAFGGARPTLAADALESLKSRHWPGNIRELKNALEHASIEARGGIIHTEHLPIPHDAEIPTDLASKLGQLAREWVHAEIAAVAPREPEGLHERLMAVVESALLAEVLQQLQGNRLVAGRWLGLARATVRKLIRKYQLEAESDDPDDVEIG